MATATIDGIATRYEILGDGPLLTPLEERELDATRSALAAL